MRKKYAALVLILLVAGCSSTETPVQTGSIQNSPTGQIDKDQKSNEVVNRHGEMTNLEKFYSFLNNVGSGKPDKVRITQYTVEGDPIYYDLNYNGKEIEYTFDNSNDGYAGQNKGRRSTQCTGMDKVMEKDQDVTWTRYVLKGCKTNVGNTFSFSIRN